MTVSGNSTLAGVTAGDVTASGVTVTTTQTYNNQPASYINSNLLATQGFVEAMITKIIIPTKQNVTVYPSNITSASTAYGLMNNVAIPLTVVSNYSTTTITSSGIVVTGTSSSYYSIDCDLVFSINLWPSGVTPIFGGGGIGGSYELNGLVGNVGITFKTDTSGNQIVCLFSGGSQFKPSTFITFNFSIIWYNT